MTGGETAATAPASASQIAEPVTVAPERLPAAVAELVAAGGRMQMLYGWYPKPGEFELRYLASRDPGQPFLIWRCVPGGPMPSVAPISPLLSWYEREITDLYGQEFVGQPEPDPLILPRGAKAIAPPLDPAYPADTRIMLASVAAGLVEVESPDVQRLPFGPVRADVVESVQLVFFYVGEHILHLHPELFFKHRGMEKRFERALPDEGVVLAERVSGIGSFAHGLAFCQAVERAAGCIVPPRALMLRSLLAELERLYNHLHYLGHLCRHDDAQGRRGRGQAARRTGQADQRAADGQPLPARRCSRREGCAAISTRSRGSAKRSRRLRRRCSSTTPRCWRLPTAISTV